MNGEESIGRAASLIGHAGEVASRLRAGGAQRVVGCFPVYSPVEVPHSLGAIPIALAGAGGAVEILHADARFQSFVCSIAKSSLELALRGEIAGLDAVLFQSICDVARNLASVFERNLPAVHVDYIHLPQNVLSPAAVPYYAAELRRVRTNLARHLGQPEDDEALARSIRLYNQVRALLGDLHAMRRRSPEKASACEVVTLTRATQCMGPEDAAAMIAEALPALAGREARRRDRIKVVVEGAFCEQPPLDLISAIEDAGCYIVDDDVAIGWRFFDGAVDETGDPVEALACAYVHRAVPSSVRHDGDRPRTERLVARVREAGADAVLFLPAKFCEPALLDYARYRGALEAAEIPHLVLEFEEKMWTFDRARNEVETFVESLLFE